MLLQKFGTCLACPGLIENVPGGADLFHQTLDVGGKTVKIGDGKDAVLLQDDHIHGILLHHGLQFAGGLVSGVQIFVKLAASLGHRKDLRLLAVAAAKPAEQGGHIIKISIAVADE